MTDEKRIRIGIVGLRNIGKGHLRKALALSGATVTALADTDAERLEEARSLIDGDATCHAAADALFASPDVDAVVLAVPNALHAPMSIAAMRHGKDVLVEKPMAMNAAEAREMVDVRDETRRVLMVGMNQRFVPWHVTARKAVAAGEIGSVLQCRTRWVLDRPFGGLWERGDWFLSGETSGGGPLIDLGVHRLDLALYLIGHPQVSTVTGLTSRGIGRSVAAARGKSYDLEDYAMGFLRFADGGALTVEASYFWNEPGKPQDTIIVGTQGCLTVGKEVTIARWDGETPQTTELAPDASTATSCIEHFVRVLRGEEELIPTPEQGLQTHRLIDAIYKSAETGRMLTIDDA